MTYTVTNLITDAYYASSVVSRQFSTIQGYQLSTGFAWLNQILQDKAVDSGDIPYITTLYPFRGVPGQEQYFIPGLIDIEAIVFYINSVRYEMSSIPRQKYFGTPRANNISALPLSYTYERTFGGVNIFLYFFPNENYLFNITGNFFMQAVSLNQDLTKKRTTANLGAPTVGGTGTFAADELVINEIDLAGTYATAAALVTYINTGVISNVTAAIVSNEFILTSANGTTIEIVTNGTMGSSNYITFDKFRTQDGYFSQVFYYFALDQFYIDYVRYQLADRICTELNFTTPPQVVEQLNRYRQQISNMAEPMDLSMQKISVMTPSTGINYGQVNIGHGWSTS